MTVTHIAELCGHRWPGPLCIPPGADHAVTLGVFHTCARDSGHRDVSLHAYTRCRCRCGATTNRQEPTR